MKKNTYPRVTVYISTYNRVELLTRAVKSVLNQTYKNIELIVVDDYSSDGTLEYLKRMAKIYKNIKYFKNKKNSGACVSRNQAINRATGEFITGLDDDDEFELDRIELLMEKYNAKYSFICTSIKIVRKRNIKKSSCSNLIFNCNDLYFDNVAGNQFFCLTRNVQSIGGFDEKLKSSQDLDVMVRLCREFGNARRFKKSTYIMHLDHDKPRISTSKGKIDGMTLFLEKHKAYMSTSHKIYHKHLINYWKKKPNFSIVSSILMALFNPKKILKKGMIIFCG
jgi:glycosyltransferase involved in cell wall biosynthesis